MAETGMVERVARAIAGEIDCVDWTAPDNTMSHPARLNAIALDAARAAIEAMRDLPEPIAENLSWHFTNDIVFGNGYQVKSLWSDALDAILKEGD